MAPQCSQCHLLWLLHCRPYLFRPDCLTGRPASSRSGLCSQFVLRGFRRAVFIVKIMRICCCSRFCPPSHTNLTLRSARSVLSAAVSSVHTAFIQSKLTHFQSSNTPTAVPVFRLAVVQRVPSPPHTSHNLYTQNTLHAGIMTVIALHNYHSVFRETQSNVWCRRMCRTVRKSHTETIHHNLNDMTSTGQSRNCRCSNVSRLV